MTTSSTLRTQLMLDLSDTGVLRSTRRDGWKENNRRSSMPALGANKGGRKGMRRSTLIPSASERQEPTRLNATWGSITNRRKSRALLEALPALTSPTMARKSLLIEDGELESLTSKLWSNQFAGTIDPRFHSQYLQGAV